MAGKLYFNVHTEKNKGREIRGPSHQVIKFPSPGNPSRRKSLKDNLVKTSEGGNSVSKKAAEHHKKASEHLTHAARHHGEAAKHHDAGHHEKAAHHAHTARGHVIHARKHAEDAVMAHTEEHGKK
jgi:hypothetical protein